jgi:Rrf2 family protein
MRLTKQTEYALRALLWLALGTRVVPGQPAAGGEAGPAGGAEGSRDGGGRQKAAAIASATGIPPVFAQRVLGHLQRQGFVDARAGQQGGYALARPADGITLLEVIEAVEGPLVTRTCVLSDVGCGERGQYCVLHDAWRAGQDALRAALARTTLAGGTDVGQEARAGALGSMNGLALLEGIAGRA